MLFVFKEFMVGVGNVQDSCCFVSGFMSLHKGVSEFYYTNIFDFEETINLFALKG